MLRIRIRMFMGLPDHDPLVRRTDLYPDSSVMQQKNKKKFDPFCFVTSL
jgi:hypothetical protein